MEVATSTCTVREIVLGTGEAIIWMSSSEFSISRGLGALIIELCEVMKLRISNVWKEHSARLAVMPAFHLLDTGDPQFEVRILTLHFV